MHSPSAPYVGALHVEWSMSKIGRGVTPSPANRSIHCCLRVGLNPHEDLRDKRVEHLSRAPPSCTSGEHLGRAPQASTPDKHLGLAPRQSAPASRECSYPYSDSQTGTENSLHVEQKLRRKLRNATAPKCPPSRAPFASRTNVLLKLQR